LLFGLSIGAAATVKPIAILLLPVWLLLFCVALMARQRSWRAHMVVAGVSGLVPLCVVVVSILYWHSWAAFLDIMLHLLPLHASMFRLSPSALLLGSVSSVMLGLFLLWLPVYLILRPWRSFEGLVLLSGFCFGVVSFYTQGRGYPYHRYPSEAFLLLLASTTFVQGMQSKRKLLAVLSVAGLGFGSFVIVPRSLSQISHFDWRHDEFGSMLGRDLNDLGGTRLTGKVQCLDQAGGCIAELYKLRIVQSTGFLYDCYLFVNPADADEAVNQARYRTAFEQALANNPPSYFIVTSDECGVQAPDFIYGKLAHWPQLDHMLRSKYKVVRNRIPRNKVIWGGVPALTYGFRVYARNDLSQ